MVVAEQAKVERDPFGRSHTHRHPSKDDKTKSNIDRLNFELELVQKGQFYTIPHTVREKKERKSQKKKR